MGWRQADSLTLKHAVDCDFASMHACTNTPRINYSNSHMQIISFMYLSLVYNL